MTQHFFAHSTPDESQSNWQLLHVHLLNVAALATISGGKFGAGKAAALSGALHDLGKYTLPFQRRLSGGKSVDHSTAGAKFVIELTNTNNDRYMAELVAHVIAGHHGGMPDREGDSGLSDRVTDREVEPCDPVWQTEIPFDSKGLLPAGHSWSKDQSQISFQFSFLGRMIFSCLVDADFRDTEQFYAKVENKPVDRDWPALPAIIEPLCTAFDSAMDAKTAGAPDTPINTLRAEILAHVRAKATLPTGLFTMTVPTGGGKTLASLAFALDHARAHRLDRIIYAIPFTSVIDQTATIFRDILGENVVLEHHSAIDEERSRDLRGRDKLKLAMEDWAAPVVVTTNVQLFESLFSNRPSRCRKLHNIARSVIVLDEAQTIPLHLLLPCVAALDELARNYGCSIVLCTATQPALAAPAHPEAPGLKGGFDPARITELAPRPNELATALKRVTLRQAGTMSDAELLAELRAVEQGLIIVNSRPHALALFRAGQEGGMDGMIHLTTRQHATDRRAILAGVRDMLRDGKPCRVIATSLVEAGVDVDFPRVWRAEAGLEQIAQAAGRCNREGKRPIADSIVTVFKAADRKPLKELAQFAEDMARIAPDHEDLFSPAAIADYFNVVYWRHGERLDLEKLLAKFMMDATRTNFAYRTVAENFRMIESGLAPVIIATDETSRKAIENLKNPTIPAGVIARDLQTYIVQVPPQARKRLIDFGHVRFLEVERFGDRFAVLDQGTSGNLYSLETGLRWEDAEYLGWDGLVG